MLQAAGGRRPAILIRDGTPAGGDAALDWTTIDQITRLAPLPDGYHYDSLSSAEVPAPIEGLRQ